MAVNKAALLRIFALAMVLAGTAWQSVRAEGPATQHGGDGGSCARSEFRVLIDVGHTATSPGADSAPGVPEYEFNLKLADVIAQSLHEARVRQNGPIGHRRVEVDQSVSTCGERQQSADRPFHLHPS
jgi:hypothetical protein